MKKHLSISLTAVLLVLSCNSFLHAEKYSIDPVHSEVSFTIAHMVISKVRGRFDKFSGEFSYDEKDPKSWSTNVMIEASSINTNHEMRDKDLRSSNFFDVEKFPTLTFKSTEVMNAAKNKAKLKGLLTIHGVTKPVVLDLTMGGIVKDPWGNVRAGFEALTKINRKDFGIAYNKMLETGGMIVGEEVAIEIHIEGIQQKPGEMKK